MKIKFILVSLCFWLSGLAALIYQTAWLRRFSTIFGTSEIAVVVVLSSYMAGLALGALLASRWLHKINRPVLFYGVLEAIIAIIALGMPILLDAIQGLFLFLFGDRQDISPEIGLLQNIYTFCGVFIVILLPTTAMGATLPVLSKSVVRTNAQISTRIGFLYAINTLGAVVGTLITAFLLLPELGLRGSILFAIAINFAVFLVAVVIEKMADRYPVMHTRLASDSVPVFSWDWRGVFLLCILLSGVVSFTYEVLWTRLLGHILGGSIAAFSTMLASFLAGIGLGSLIGAAWATTTTRSVRGFWLCQLGIVITSATVYYGFEAMATPENQLNQWRVAIAIATMLPATLFIGASFPLVIRACAPSVRSASSTAGLVYSWNTLGTILGAIIAGFLLVPLFKYEGAMKFAILTSLSIALIIAGAPAMGRRRLPVALSAALLVITVLWYQPARPTNILRHSSIGSPQQGDIVFYEVGRSATVLLQKQGQRYYLRTNGLPEANTPARDQNIHRLQSALLTLPILVRPHAREALVVGLGAGSLLERLPANLERIDVFELEPEVIQANRYLASRRQFDPMTDDRIQIHTNDARGALQLVNKKWDIVVSQPSHPWTAGASHLYTKEFMRIIDDHLRPTGVYLQWLNASFMSAELMASLLRSLNDVFAYVRVYQIVPGVFYFLSSQSPIQPEIDYLPAYRSGELDLSIFRDSGIGRYDRLFSTLVMDEKSTRSYSEGAPAISDDYNYMATDSLQAVYDNRSLLGSEDYQELLAEYMPAINRVDWMADFLGVEDLAIWARIYQHLLTGKEKFLAQLRTIQPKWANYFRLQDRKLNPTDSSTTRKTENLTDIYAWSNYPKALKLGVELDLKTEFTSLPAVAQAAVRARRFAADQKFVEVAAFDSLLATAELGQPWWFDALGLRIWWRKLHIRAELEKDNEAAKAKVIELSQEIVAILDNQYYPDRYQNWLVDYTEALSHLDQPRTYLAAIHSLTSDTISELRRARKTYPHPQINEQGEGSNEYWANARVIAQERIEFIRAAYERLRIDAKTRHVASELWISLQILQTTLSKALIKRGESYTLKGFTTNELEIDLARGEVLEP